MDDAEYVNICPCFVIVWKDWFCYIYPVIAATGQENCSYISTKAADFRSNREQNSMRGEMTVSINLKDNFRNLLGDAYFCFWHANFISLYSEKAIIEWRWEKINSITWGIQCNRNEIVLGTATTKFQTVLFLTAAISRSFQEIRQRLGWLCVHVTSSNLRNHLPVKCESTFLVKLILLQRL